MRQCARVMRYLMSMLISVYDLRRIFHIDSKATGLLDVLLILYNCFNFAFMFSSADSCGHSITNLDGPSLFVLYTVLFSFISNPLILRI